MVGRIWGALGLVALLAASCSGGAGTTAGPGPGPAPAPQATAAAASDAPDICPPVDPPLQIGLPFYPPAHPAEPFAEQLFAEGAALRSVEDESLFFVNGDCNGELINVDDGIRRSAPGPEGAPVIWMLGGSTTFGLGQRDEHTIASEIVRLAADDGTPVQVVNLGVSAYLTWQEVGLFQRHLEDGPPPDLVVFYHGVNDLSHLCRQLAYGDEPGGRSNPIALPPFEGTPAQDCYSTPESSGTLLAVVLDTAMARAEQIAEAASIPIIEFWQPYLATRRPTPGDEGLLAHTGTTRSNLDGQAAVYRAALESRTMPVVDLTDAHDVDVEPVYYDFAHTNERGALLVAQAMWERALSEQVAQLDGP